MILLTLYFTFRRRKLLLAILAIFPPTTTLQPSHQATSIPAFVAFEKLLCTQPSHASMSLVSNPTYFLNDPINGDEIEQEDQRWMRGGSLRNENDIELLGLRGVRRLGLDLRAAVTKIDPVTGNSADSQQVLVQGKGSELGSRCDNGNGFNFSLAAFELQIDSELVFVGDAGSTEPSDATCRQGIEIASFWQASDALVFDLTAAKSKGHFIDKPSGANQIPDAHEEVAGAGVTYLRSSGIAASLRLRYFSDAALTEDESVRKDSSTIMNIGLSRDFGDWKVGLDVLNLLNAEDDDIAYFFESRLPGETTAVEDVHFHPSNPRSVRVKFRYEF